MAGLTLTAPMPALELANGAVIRLEAIDPTTGAAIAGVIARDFVIFAKGQGDEDPNAAPREPVWLTPVADQGRRPGDYGGPGG